MTGLIATVLACYDGIVLSREERLSFSLHEWLLQKSQDEPRATTIFIARTDDCSFMDKCRDQSVMYPLSTP